MIGFLYPFVWLGLWALVTTILGLLAGHASLLKAFPPDETDEVDWLHFVSGRVGFVSFGSSLTVGLGRRGLHLAPGWLFRPPFWRGIPCIPWSEVALVASRNDSFLDLLWGTRFRIRSQQLDFKLRGAAADAVEARLRAPGGAGR